MSSSLGEPSEIAASFFAFCDDRPRAWLSLSFLYCFCATSIFYRTCLTVLAVVSYLVSAFFFSLCCFRNVVFLTFFFVCLCTFVCCVSGLWGCFVSQVDNMAELGWRPREVLGTLVDVYLSLSACPPFAEAVAGDERSYKRYVLEYPMRRCIFRTPLD